MTWAEHIHLYACTFVEEGAKREDQHFYNRKEILWYNILYTYMKFQRVGKNPTCLTKC